MLGGCYASLCQCTLHFAPLNPLPSSGVLLHNEFLPAAATARLPLPYRRLQSNTSYEVTGRCILHIKDRYIDLNPNGQVRRLPGMRTGTATLHRWLHCESCT